MAIDTSSFLNLTGSARKVGGYTPKVTSPQQTGTTAKNGSFDWRNLGNLDYASPNSRTATTGKELYLMI